MSDSEFTYYKELDSLGYDIKYVGKKTVDELKELCRKDPNCVGFNTLGFMKNFIQPESKFQKVSFMGSDDGLYVNNERLKTMQTKFSHVEFDGYKFYKNKDSTGNDIRHIKCTSLDELKVSADNDPNCLGFNTYGFLKNYINNECDLIELNSINHDGLYVKQRKFRVKMMCNWCNSKQLCKEWNVMSKGNYCWNDIEITWENDNIDFYVIINKPLGNDFFIPHRTIVFQMEPWCDDPTQNWGVKTWGEWALPDENKFLQVRSHRNNYNNCFWQLKTTYNDFKNNVIQKTKGNIISSVCSSKYFDPGHIKRIDFLKYMENKNDDVVKINVYNHDNDHKFESYMGPHPPGNKDVGVLPYKYYFMAENNQEINFITEKIWESLIGECLCFYWGCPNLSEYIDPRAYIVLPLDDYEKSFQIVKEAILNDEWGKRLEIIRREKQKVLEYYNFFPTLERILKHDYQFNYKPTDEEIKYKKIFKDTHNKKLDNVCFIHSCTLTDTTEILDELLLLINDTKLYDSLDQIYVINIGNKIPQYDLEKVKVINYSDNPKLFEIPTINLMNIFSKFHKNTKVLYLHTKGSSYGNSQPTIDDWKNYMLYFLIEQHKVCMDLLDIYDTVGCNYQDTPHKHYSGNFWWAHGSYLSKLPQITSGIRHDAEWWVLSNNTVNKHVLYNTYINHYHDVYPKEKYVNDDTKNMLNSFYKFNDKMRIKCVNLARRPDRKENVMKLLEQEGLMEHCDMFEAVDGQALLPTDELRKLFANNDFKSKRGVIGCALSHLELWNQLLKDDVYDKYLVLEDDIDMADNMKLKLNRLMQLVDTIPNCDIVYLGNHIYKHNMKHYNAKLTTRDIGVAKYDTKLTIGGTFGYIVTKSGAKKFVDFIDYYGIKHGIDYLMFHYDKEMGLEQYEVLPRLVTSDYVDSMHIADSDIQYDTSRLF